MARKSKYKPVEIGDIYGKLKVIKKGKRKNSKQYWLCKCECNNYKEIVAYDLQTQKTKSCGCGQIQALLLGGVSKRQKTFTEWCTENNRIDILNLWDYELNTINPNDISFTTNKKYYFKCKNLDKNHHSELKRIANITNFQEGSSDCIQCKSFATWGMENLCDNFLDRYWDYNKNVINPFEINKSSNKKVWIKCQDKNYHDSYGVRCNDFIKGSRCPYCTNRLVHKLDSLGYLYPDVLLIWSDKNKKSPFEYAPFSNQKVWWKCSDNLHNDYYKSISDSNVNSFHCPECSKLRKESYLQESVRTYIENLGYNVNTEHNCSIVPHNPKTKKPMPFDNEVVKLKLIIEVNGRQHYAIDMFNYIYAFHYNITPEQSLKQRKLYDRYKKAVAEHNGYFYLEIPYFTEKDESYKKLIDDKIKEIIKITKIAS